VFWAMNEKLLWRCSSHNKMQRKLLGKIKLWRKVSLIFTNYMMQLGSLPLVRKVSLTESWITSFKENQTEEKQRYTKTEKDLDIQTVYFFLHICIHMC
jgi:hypothetical protein